MSQINFYFKNQAEREKFISDYKSWEVWFDEPRTESTYYKTDLTKGFSFVVVEHDVTRTDWLKLTEDGKHPTYESVAVEYYILDPDKHFYECKASRTAMVNFLKDNYPARTARRGA